MKFSIFILFHFLKNSIHVDAFKEKPLMNSRGKDIAEFAETPKNYYDSIRSGDKYLNSYSNNVDVEVFVASTASTVSLKI